LTAYLLRSTEWMISWFHDFMILLKCLLRKCSFGNDLTVTISRSLWCRNWQIIVIQIIHFREIRLNISWCLLPPLPWISRSTSLTICLEIDSATTKLRLLHQNQQHYDSDEMLPQYTNGRSNLMRPWFCCFRECNLIKWKVVEWFSKCSNRSYSSPIVNWNLKQFINEFRNGWDWGFLRGTAEDFNKRKQTKMNKSGWEKWWPWGFNPHPLGSMSESCQIRSLCTSLSFLWLQQFHQEDVHTLRSLCMDRDGHAR
jgi:hypothetical protein